MQLIGGDRCPVPCALSVLQASTSKYQLQTHISILIQREGWMDVQESKIYGSTTAVVCKHMH